MISVIVPIYNREKTLKRCIESILLSSYSNIELILVDDGSTDKSWEIVCSYSDERIIKIHQENKGISSARNTGILAATGEYIHFVDSDDFICSDLYEFCYDKIKSYNPDMILFNHYVYFENDERKYESENMGIQRNKLLERSYIIDNILPVMANISDKKEYFIENFVWHKLFRKNILDEHNIIFDVNRTRWEDRIFLVEYLRWTSSLYYIPRVGYYYVIGNSFFEKKYDKTVFAMIANGGEYYESILGEMYEFGTEYEANYYSKVFLATIEKQYSIPTLNEFILREDLLPVITSNNIQEMFLKFSPSTSYEEEAKDAIIHKDIDQLLMICKAEYLYCSRQIKGSQRLNQSFVHRLRTKLSVLLSKTKQK